MKLPTYTIAAVYDTETCNVGEHSETRAYPILFIDNDIRDIDLYNYEPDRDDKVKYFRYEQEYIARIAEYIEWGQIVGKVPIICAYNLMFDLQPLMEDLNARYRITANAQSSTNVYTLDLLEDNKIVLRFWDTYHLEMGGLSAMGETAGLPKADGDWNYTLIRTPETPLTDMELFYAKRDVEVIPAYLRYLLRANEWMQQSDLGFRVLTKTSVVRQMAGKEIAPRSLNEINTKLKVGLTFNSAAKKNLAPTFDMYALRKACFRGGFTFTSARYALTIQRNVVSADVTSMHHTFINGRLVPQDFAPIHHENAEEIFAKIVNTSLDDVLNRYAKPFNVAFHAKVRIRNIRLRKGTCFEKWGIALESTAKFKKRIKPGGEIGYDPANAMQENVVRGRGWHDEFEGATFAFGKLYKADEIIIHINELELWTLSRVYEWDAIECLLAEGTQTFRMPPEYVTLQSNKLFEQKSAAKFVSFHYEKGKPYEHPTKHIPEGIAASLRNGTLEPQFFESWYSSTVKGMFNGIYGTQAQDIFKPSYTCIGGYLVIDESTVTTPENYESKKPKRCKVMYTYGMRIVGGSRMHMVIAMELLDKALGNRIRVLGGDTDSMKIACDEDVTDAEIQAALDPIAVASTKAIDFCMQRVRKNFPDIASGLNGIGSFEIENAGRHYPIHYEMWNKARVSWDGKHSHITCAGLPRPVGMYTIETFIDELVNAGYPPEEVFTQCLGFDTFVSYDISHTLEHRRPKVTDIYDKEVTDYLGNTTHVQAHESVALYAEGRWLGESIKQTNRLTIDFLKTEYGREVDTTMKQLYRSDNDGVAELYRQTDDGMALVMRGKKC